MTTGRTPRLVVVLDGSTDVAGRQARALGAFLRDGGGGATDGGLTVVFYADERDGERLVRLAPTRDVQLLQTRARRPDLMVAALEGLAGDDDEVLLVFPGGPLGTELATRLACRTGGGVVTDVLGLSFESGRLVGHRHVYSGHLTGRLELARGPWCVTADAGWYDAAHTPPAEHRVVTGTAVTEREARDADDPGSPLTDVDVLGAPQTGDLEGARFLVVAGRGAGSRESIERIATAARRMGAAFGVTRPVALNAWAPMDRLIGVSGTRTAPAVCIVAGASGAPAFLWGIERAGFIAAVDTDEHAAIVTEADVAVIDDGVAVLEALAELVAGETGETGDPAV